MKKVPKVCYWLKTNLDLLLKFIISYHIEKIYGKLPIYKQSPDLDPKYKNHVSYPLERGILFYSMYYNIFLFHSALVGAPLGDGPKDKFTSNKEKYGCVYKCDLSGTDCIKLDSDVKGTTDSLCTNSLS